MYEELTSVESSKTRLNMKEEMPRQLVDWNKETMFEVHGLVECCNKWSGDIVV